MFQTIDSNECYSESMFILQDIPHDHLILNCCSGFKNNDDATACLPVCSSFCKSDSCIDKDVCIKCQTGYSEPFCLKGEKELKLFS